MLGPEVLLWGPALERALGRRLVTKSLELDWPHSVLVRPRLPLSDASPRAGHLTKSSVSLSEKQSSPITCRAGLRGR